MTSNVNETIYTVSDVYSVNTNCGKGISDLIGDIMRSYIIK